MRRTRMQPTSTMTDPIGTYPNPSEPYTMSLRMKIISNAIIKHQQNKMDQKALYRFRSLPKKDRALARELERLVFKGNKFAERLFQSI